MGDLGTKARREGAAETAAPAALLDVLCQCVHSARQGVGQEVDRWTQFSHHFINAIRHEPWSPDFLRHSMPRFMPKAEHQSPYSDLVTA